MIKKTGVADLRIGMYVHDICADWLSHPFLRSRFALTKESQIQAISESGIHEVYIDTERGLDAPNAPTRDEVDATVREEMLCLAADGLPAQPQLTVGEELDRARAVRSQATNWIRQTMHEVRLGKAVKIDEARAVVENITRSVLRNSGALVALMQVKDRDESSFLHSVSACTLMVAFCRSLDFDVQAIREVGLGGLLHDTGKALVPPEVLSKQGRLTAAEFATIKKHPRDGYEILLRTPEIREIPLDITLHHHERIDGNGYPDNLSGENTSRIAKIAAIVDVYDAVTVERTYHRAMTPTDALRNLFEWSKFHLDAGLVKAFVRCIGIYPVGTLVLLESGRLGVVSEHNDKKTLLAPKVKVFYDTHKRHYIAPVVVDLNRPMGSGGADAIVRHESASKWGVDPMRFL